MKGSTQCGPLRIKGFAQPGQTSSTAGILQHALALTEAVQARVLEAKDAIAKIAACKANSMNGVRLHYSSIEYVWI